MELLWYVSYPNTAWPLSKPIVFENVFLSMVYIQHDSLTI